MRRYGLMALAIVVVASVAMAVVGGTGHAARKATVKIAVVTDIGGLNDRSFNHLANLGRLEAQSKLHIPTRIYVTQSAAQRLTNLQAAAQAGYQLVFATGFSQFDALGKVSFAFPKTDFAGIDVPNSIVAGHPQNVKGLVFHEEQAGYLVGYIAGLTVKRQGGKQVIGAVGANNVPAIVHYMAGYQAGGIAADPALKGHVLLQFANDPTFNDQAKCKVTATNEIGQGAQVIFQVAGGCGLGALDAAKRAHIWGIGVDADQAYLGPHILTSALKGVDIALFKTAQAFVKNPASFKGGPGYDEYFPVAVGTISKKVPASDLAKFKAIQAQVLSGKIKVPSAF